MVKNTAVNEITVQTRKYLKKLKESIDKINFCLS